MDANGLRFWMLADEDHWLLDAAMPGVAYDGERRSLRLARERPGAVLPSDDSAAARTEAQARLERIPRALDRYHTWAYWNANAGQIMAAGALPGEVPIYEPTAGEVPTDLAMGYDGVLYIAIAGKVTLIDRRGRWQPVTLQAEDFSAWRLAADPRGGVWVLDRARRRVGHVEGQPLPEGPPDSYAPDTPRPVDENPDPPRLRLLTEPAWSAEEEPVAIASSPEGCVALLNWVEDGPARVRLLLEQENWSEALLLAGTHFPYSLAWVAANLLAVMVVGLGSEAPVYAIGEDLSVQATFNPTGDFYPLHEHDGGPFLHGLDLPPHYPQASSSAPGAGTALYHLSLPSFAAKGQAANQRPLDSGSAQTIWHRLYVEAAIPEHCGFTVYLAASDSAQPPPDEEKGEWHAHHFGTVFATQPTGRAPRAAWVSQPSEIPFHSGMTGCEIDRDRIGLFTVLIQRPERRVRSLRGRYLHVRVSLFGDCRTTPEIWALRAYASRFSYLNHYLPELYRETLFGLDADQVVSDGGTSTAPDFLERFLDNFEGILTPLEDRIAAAYLLTDTHMAPEEALEWLGSWIGVSLEPMIPADRRRRMLAHAPELFKSRGTLTGLKLALDLATDGAVESGEIVIVEDWRLRRTFATILGVDLADEQDPLTEGLAASGNSYVGDTLFLGDENRKEFLALFGDEFLDKNLTALERKAVEALYERLSYRVTVLVHQEVEPQDLGLIRQVVKLETPVHLLSRVAPASWPFLVGVASLVGVDTYLATKPASRPVRVGSSWVGVRDLLYHPPSLDPRLESGQ